MTSKYVRMFALAGILAAGACDDSLVPGELDQAEAEDLASAVLSASFVQALTLQGQSPAATDGPAMAPYEYSSDIQTAGSCALGGNVALDASVDVSGDDETGESRLDVVVILVHNGCVVDSERGRRFTLNGNPSLTLDLLAETNAEGASSFGGTLTGAVDWVHDGREGTCAIAYEFAGSASGQGAASFTMGGSVCGSTIQQEFTVG